MADPPPAPPIRTESRDAPWRLAAGRAIVPGMTRLHRTGPRLFVALAAASFLFAAPRSVQESAHEVAVDDRWHADLDLATELARANDEPLLVAFRCEA